jgi:hypothetical protein
MITANYKKLPTFTCEASDLGDALARIITITEFGQNPGTPKQYILVSDGDTLYVIGLATDVTVYLTIPIEADVDGVCSFDAATLLGLLKKRKGQFKFTAKGGNLDFKALKARYKGYIALKEVTSDVGETLNDIDTSIKGTVLKASILQELKTAIKWVSQKDICKEVPLIVNIDCIGGIFTAATLDSYHGTLYRSTTKYTNKDFQLSVASTAYNVIDKFVANCDVSFSLGSSLILTNSDIYAAIPAMQRSEDAIGLIEKIEKIANGKQKIEFTVNCTLLADRLTSMSVLKNTALEAQVPYCFTLNDDKLTIVYTTSSGSVTEVVKCANVTGEGSFRISDKLALYTFTPLSSLSEITFTVSDNSFSTHYTNAGFTITTSGALTEPENS